LFDFAGSDHEFALWVRGKNALGLSERVRFSSRVTPVSLEA
jgi:hypothetical protein